MAEAGKAAMFSDEDQANISKISKKAHDSLVAIVAGVGELGKDDEKSAKEYMDIMNANDSFGKLAYRELLLLKEFELKKTTIEELTWLAKDASETAERFEDMCIFIKYLILKRLELLEKDKAQRGDYKGENGPLKLSERNLFSVAYKNVVGVRRGSWRILNDKGNEVYKDMSKEQKAKAKEYSEVIAGEIETVCNEIQWLLGKLAAATEKLKKEDTLAAKNDSFIFYKKMIGDYYRYMREAFEGQNKYKEECEAAYKEAMQMAVDTLPPTDPTRLGLALNYSVCHYEILDNKDEACKLAKEAFDQAIEKLDSLNDASYKDSTLIMQLLRDNLTIWSSNTDKEQPTDQ